jgi:hypothetical protein
MFIKSLIDEVFIASVKNEQPAPELFESSQVIPQAELLMELFVSP